MIKLHIPAPPKLAAINRAGIPKVKMPAKAKSSKPHQPFKDTYDTALNLKRA